MSAKKSPRRIVTNPFKNKNIGRRTGKDVKAGKVIRKTAGGFENFDDYWSESDADVTRDETFVKPGTPAVTAAPTQASSNEKQTTVSKPQQAAHSSISTSVMQSAVLAQLQAGNVVPVKGALNPFKNKNIGRRTGKDIKAGKNIGVLHGGFENFDDYWSESDADSMASFSSSTISRRSSLVRPTPSGSIALESTTKPPQPDQEGNTRDPGSTKENYGTPIILSAEEEGSDKQDATSRSTSENLVKLKLLTEDEVFSSKVGTPRLSSTKQNWGTPEIVTDEEDSTDGQQTESEVGSQGGVEADCEQDDRETIYSQDTESQESETADSQGILTGSSQGEETADSQGILTGSSQGEETADSRGKNTADSQGILTGSSQGEETVESHGEETAESQGEETADIQGNECAEETKTGDVADSEENDDRGSVKTRQDLGVKRVVTEEESSDDRQTDIIADSGEDTAKVVMEEGSSDDRQTDIIDDSGEDAAKVVTEEKSSDDRQTEVSAESEEETPKALTEEEATDSQGTVVEADGKETDERDTADSQDEEAADDCEAEIGVQENEQNNQHNRSKARALGKESKKAHVDETNRQKSVIEEVGNASTSAQAPRQNRSEHAKQKSAQQPVAGNSPPSLSQAALSQMNTATSPALLTQKSSVYVSMMGDVTGSITCQENDKLTPQPRLFGTRKRLSYSYAADSPEVARKEKIAKSRLPKEPTIQEHHYEAEKTLPQPTHHPLLLSQSQSNTSETGTFLSLTSKPTNKDRTQAIVTHSAFSDEDEEEFEILDDSRVYNNNVNKETKSRAKRGASFVKRASPDSALEKEGPSKSTPESVQSHTGDEPKKNARQTKAKRAGSEPPADTKKSSDSEIEKSMKKTSASGNQLKSKAGKSSKKETKMSKISESSSVAVNTVLKEALPMIESLQEADFKPGVKKLLKGQASHGTCKSKGVEKGSENKPAIDQQKQTEKTNRRKQRKIKANQDTDKHKESEKASESGINTENKANIEKQTDTDGDVQTTKKKLKMTTLTQDRRKSVNHKKKPKAEKETDNSTTGKTGNIYSQSEKADDVGGSQLVKKAQNRKKHDTDEAAKLSELLTVQKSRTPPKRGKKASSKVSQYISEASAAEHHEKGDIAFSEKQVDRMSSVEEEVVRTHPETEADKVNAKDTQTAKKKRNKSIGRQNAEEKAESQETQSDAGAVVSALPNKKRKQQLTVSDKQTVKGAHSVYDEKQAVIPLENDTGKQTPKKQRRKRLSQVGDKEPAAVIPLESDAGKQTSKKQKKATGQVSDKDLAAVIPLAIDAGKQTSEKQKKSTRQVSDKEPADLEADAGVVSKRFKQRKLSLASERKEQEAAQEPPPSSSDRQEDQGHTSPVEAAATEEPNTPATPFLLRFEVGDSALKSGISFRRLSHHPSSSRAKRSRKQLSIGASYEILPDDIATPPLCKQPRTSARMSESTDSPLVRPKHLHKAHNLSSCLSHPRLSGDGTPCSKDSRRVTISNIVTQHDLSSPGSSGEASSSLILPSMSVTPVHYFHVSSCATEPHCSRSDWDKDKIIRPEHRSADGLRRSKRTRVKRLEWYKNERIVYDRRKSGPVIVAVKPSRERLYLEQEELKRKKRHEGYLVRKKQQQLRGHPTRRLSTQLPLPEDVHLTPHSEVTVLHPHTMQAVHMACFNPASCATATGPRGEVPTHNDPYTISLLTQQRLFTTGVLKLAPAAEKPLQRAISTAVLFSVTYGNVLVTINTASRVMEMGDHFFVPGGTVYKLKNMRCEEAVLTFSNLMMEMEEQLSMQADEPLNEQSDESDGQDMP